MNYLAHLLISPDDGLFRLGNIMADFMRDVDPNALPEKVWEGIQLHREVDGYTDSHEVVRGLRKHFSPEKRRFSGIVLDVVFDHFLIKHWEKYSSREFNAFVDECYQDLWQHRGLMPAQMEMVVGWMIKRDWIRSYAELEHVGRALDGLASRLKLKHNFHGSVEEVHEHYEAIESGFTHFFPELLQHVNQSKGKS
ncbi:MAG: ACP phosphodiesterase [Candidatus Marinimicrobia bacterium]|nr:ACP phosphodiesterase [Candidatus Neomarinimicrobiota bacterium]